MGFLVLSIVSNALIYLIFRYLGKGKGKDNPSLFPVIVINYWTAAFLSLNAFLVIAPFRLPADPLAYELALVLALLFAGGFYFLGRTTQAYGVARANIIARTSLVIPAIFSVFQYNEPITKSKTVGVLLSLLAIIFTIGTTSQRSKARAIDFAVLAFMASGLIDVVFKIFQNEVFSQMNIHPITISLLIFTFAALISTLILVAWIGLSSITFQVVRHGVVLGIVNFASVYFFLQLLNKEQSIQGSILFPLNGVAIVILSTFLAWFVFNELPRGRQWIGIILGLVAIALLAGAHVVGI